MAAYRQVYDSRHLQADYQEPGSDPEPYVRQSSIGYLYFFTSDYLRYLRKKQSVIHLPTPLENAPHELVKYQTFYYLTEGLHCTSFSVLAFSST